MKMHIRVWRLALLVGTQSHTTEAVVEDMVNILGGLVDLEMIFLILTQKDPLVFDSNHVLAKLPDH